MPKLDTGNEHPLRRRLRSGQRASSEGLRCPRLPREVTDLATFLARMEGAEQVSDAHLAQATQLATGTMVRDDPQLPSDPELPNPDNGRRAPGGGVGPALPQRWHVGARLLLAACFCIVPAGLPLHIAPELADTSTVKVSTVEARQSIGLEPFTPAESDPQTAIARNDLPSHPAPVALALARTRPAEFEGPTDGVVPDAGVRPGDTTAHSAVRLPDRRSASNAETPPVSPKAAVSAAALPLPQPPSSPTRAERIVVAPAPGPQAPTGNTGPDDSRISAPVARTEPAEPARPEPRPSPTSTPAAAATDTPIAADPADQVSLSPEQSSSPAHVAAPLADLPKRQEHPRLPAPRLPVDTATAAEAASTVPTTDIGTASAPVAATESRPARPPPKPAPGMADVASPASAVSVRSEPASPAPTAAAPAPTISEPPTRSEFQTPPASPAHASPPTPAPQVVERAPPAVTAIPVTPLPIPTGTKAAAKHPAPVPPATTAIFMRRAESLIETGDISGARLLFERAADLGSGAAALAMARTFDPAYLTRLQASIPPDRATAIIWYRRATALGNSEAQGLLREIDALPPK